MTLHYAILAFVANLSWSTVICEVTIPDPWSTFHDLRYGIYIMYVSWQWKILWFEAGPTYWHALWDNGRLGSRLRITNQIHPRNSFWRVDSDFDFHFVIWLTDKKSIFCSFDLAGPVDCLSVRGQFKSNRMHWEAHNRGRNLSTSSISISK